MLPYSKVFGMRNAAVFSCGTPKATLLLELHAGLISGVVVPAPGEKLHRVPTAGAVVVLPTSGVAPVAPKGFWRDAQGPGGEPLAYGGVGADTRCSVSPGG